MSIIDKPTENSLATCILSFVSLPLSGWRPVSDCGDRSPLEFEVANGSRFLNQNEFTNQANPRNVASGDLMNESIMVSGLEEFVSYEFVVFVATSQGRADGSYECSRTLPESKYITHMYTHT